MHGPGWPDTLLIWTYDEHGGYYDHVAPPAAVPPDDVPGRSLVAHDSWLRRILKPLFPGYVRHCESLVARPLTYDTYGFRVPAVIISPYARPDCVLSEVFDHTSVLKLVEEKWNLPALTRRDAAATSPIGAVDLSAPPAFLNPPVLPAPEPAVGLLVTAASALLVPDRQAGARVEEMQLAGLDVDAGILALGQRRLRIHPRDQCGQRGDVLRLVRVMGDRADPAVDVHLRAELLAQPYGQLYAPPPHRRRAAASASDRCSGRTPSTMSRPRYRSSPGRVGRDLRRDPQAVAAEGHLRATRAVRAALQLRVDQVHRRRPDEARHEQVGRAPV